MKKKRTSSARSLLLQKFQASTKRKKSGGWRAGGGLFALPSQTVPKKRKKKKIVRAARTQSLVATPRKRKTTEALPAIAEKPPGISSEDLIRPGVDLSERIAAFLLDQRSEHTRRAYGKDLKRFVGFLRWRRLEKGIERVERSTVIAYKEYLLAEKLEHTTVDRHLATLRSFFGWLQQDGVIQVNPAEGVRFLNPKRISKTRGLSDEQVRRLLALPDLHTRTGCLHHAVLTVLLYCGLRRSELCSLKLTSLGMERGRPVVRLLGKGNSERIVPLVPAVVESLSRYARMTRRPLPFDALARGIGRDSVVLPDEPLFRAVKSKAGKDQGTVALDPSTVFYIVTRYSRKAGITERISPHSCRATAISHARDRNAPDRAIQEFAGWASPDMITRYDKRKTAIEKSAALLIQYDEKEKEREQKNASLSEVPEDASREELTSLQ